MISKFDVFAAIIKKKEATVAEVARYLNESYPSVHRFISILLSDNFIGKNGNLYSPNNGKEKAGISFSIIKDCINSGINYNFFFSEKLADIVLIGYSKEKVKRDDFGTMNDNTLRGYLKRLIDMNMIIVENRKPLKLNFLENEILSNVLRFYDKEPEFIDIKTKEKHDYGIYEHIEKELKKFSGKNAREKYVRDFEEVKIDFVHGSTELEGNTLSLDEVHEILVNDIVPANTKIKETNEVRDYGKAVEYLIEHLDEDISMKIILDVQRFVLYNSDIASGIRTENVKISGNPFFKIKNYKSIMTELEELIRKINSELKKDLSVRDIIEFATYVHNEFQHIHPFRDGNSRTTRLLWNYVLMKRGFPLINIYPQTKREYMNLTKLSKARNDDKLSAFLAKVILDNLNKRTNV